MRKIRLAEIGKLPASFSKVNGLSLPGYNMGDIRIALIIGACLGLAVGFVIGYNIRKSMAYSLNNINNTPDQES